MKNILVCFYLLLPGITYAQTSVQEAHFNNEKNLFKFISKTLSQARRRKAVDSMCVNSVACAKFTVDSVGKIASLHFSKNTPIAIKELLTEVINSTDGYWNPRKINGKAVESKPFLLTLVYFLNTGCLNWKDGPDQFSSALPNLFTFDNDEKSHDQLDCIILGTITLYPAVR